MIKSSRLNSAKAKIISYFSDASKKIYLEAELRDILRQQRELWHLSQSTRVFEFISFLEQRGQLMPLTLRSAKYGLTIKRYSWGKTSPLELALSIKSRGYLSHETALMLHGLTKLSLKTIYLNAEQSVKPQSSGLLTQHGIDLAFLREQRQSKLIYKCAGASVIMIAGKNTNRLGVEVIVGPTSELLEVTNLERTLIDIVVRPAYAGGIHSVLRAYRAAKDRISVDQLLQILEQLNYVYPYHQTIGYLMQKADYPEKSFAKLRELGLNHDFYFAHGMKQPAYSNEWRLFHPMK